MKILAAAAFFSGILLAADPTPKAKDEPEITSAMEAEYFRAESVMTKIQAQEAQAQAALQIAATQKPQAQADMQTAVAAITKACGVKTPTPQGKHIVCAEAPKK